LGYTTEFTGAFRLDRPLTEEQAAYLRQFATTRRMVRHEAIVAGMPDPVREAVRLPPGPEGAYFVGGAGFMGQEADASVVNEGTPPSGQPGLWCQWTPTPDRAGLAWDGGEKFYFYAEWLEYLIEHFLAPWGYRLDGTVMWVGEEPGDEGVIEVEDNRVTVRAEEDDAALQGEEPDEG
jgi:hypothetical protein